MGIFDYNIFYSFSETLNIIEDIVEFIFKDLDIYIFKSDYKHITELLLDEILILIDTIPNQKYINYINNIDISNLDNSTKFKINNIIDKYK